MSCSNETYTFYIARFAVASILISITRQISKVSAVLRVTKKMVCKEKSSAANAVSLLLLLIPFAAEILSTLSRASLD